jgi:alkylation response protein AidB-like acyl-CoA dehydrogenase
VTIALRYACQRPQFGDKTIMGYLTHQDRLLPVLANAYTLHLALGSLKVRAQSGELVRRPSLEPAGVSSESRLCEANVKTVRRTMSCCPRQSPLGYFRGTGMLRSPLPPPSPPSGRP